MFALKGASRTLYKVYG